MKLSHRMSYAGVIAAIALTVAGCTSAGTDDAQSGADLPAADLAAYQSVAEAAMGPTEVWPGPTEAPAMKSGVKAMFISCGLAAEGCRIPAEAAEEAAGIIGWEMRVVDGQFDPQTYNRAIAEAVDQDYDVILMSSISSESVAESLKAARAAGIVVGSFASGNEPSDTGVDFEVATPHDAMGEAQASYLIWKTDGKLNADLLNAPEFKVVDTAIMSMVDTIEGCATCEAPKLDNFTSAAAATELPPLVTSNLRQDPGMNAVVGGYDTAMFQVIPAIEQASLPNEVFISSFDGTAPFLAFVQNGQATSTVAIPNAWGAWAAIDNANRVLNGEEPVDQHIPFRLFSVDNVEDIPTSGEQWAGDVDYKSQFQTIWGVTG